VYGPDIEFGAEHLAQRLPHHGDGMRCAEPLDEHLVRVREHHRPVLQIVHDGRRQHRFEGLRPFPYRVTEVLIPGPNGIEVETTGLRLGLRFGRRPHRPDSRGRILRRQSVFVDGFIGQRYIIAGNLCRRTGLVVGNTPRRHCTLRPDRRCRGGFGDDPFRDS